MSRVLILWAEDLVEFFVVCSKTIDEKNDNYFTKLHGFQQALNYITSWSWIKLDWIDYVNLEKSYGHQQINPFNHLTVPMSIYEKKIVRLVSSTEKKMFTKWNSGD